MNALDIMEIGEFVEHGNFNVANASGVSAQGVTVDEDHYFETDSSTLRKILKSNGSLVTQRTTTGDGNTNVVHNNDLCVVGDYIYIAVNNFNIVKDNPSVPTVSVIKKYNKSDLTYVSQVQVAPDSGNGVAATRISCITYDPVNDTLLMTGGEGWNIQKRDMNLDFIDQVVADFQGDFGTYHRWNGMKIVDDNVFFNHHEQRVDDYNAKAPQVVQQFVYDRDNFRFYVKRNILRPYHCCQGLDYDPEFGNFVFVRRESSRYPAYSSTQLVQTRPEPRDWRELTNFASVAQVSQQSHGGSSDVAISGTGVSIKARRGDIIRVMAQGRFWVTTGYVEVKIELSSSSPLDDACVQKVETDYSKIVTNRTGDSDSVGQGETTFKDYHVHCDGEFKFNLQWKKGNGGTAYAKNMVVTANIIGKAANSKGDQ